MHILIVNDDGPPSQADSPYVHHFIRHLQAQGHLVSVCLPDRQRSWIGKAIFANQNLTPSYYIPGEPSFTDDTGTVNQLPQPAESEAEEWLLIDGTPACCAMIGLAGAFKDRGPVDLVVSGPNYGRNSGAAYALSSGTIGGAMEGAMSGFKGIAVSFAFRIRNGTHVPDQVNAACRQAVRVIDQVMKPGRWPADADVLTINVPLVEDVESRKVLWTSTFANRWEPGVCHYSPIPFPTGRDGNAGEQVTADKVEVGQAAEQKPVRFQHQKYLWAPAVYRTTPNAATADEFADSRVVLENNTSITPLKANFMQVEGFKGDFLFE